MMPNTRKPKVFNTLKLDQPSHGRFNVELDQGVEEPLQHVVTFVHERYPGFFDLPEKCEKYQFDMGVEAYSEEDGFPPILDLKAYFDGDNMRTPVAGKSIFLSEYERLNGDIAEEDVQMNASDGEDYNVIEVENLKKIQAMDSYEIEKARQEIYEKLSKESVDFLKRRAVEKKSKKISLFKQQRQGLKPEIESCKKVEDNLVESLEVISDYVDDSPETNESLARVAIDPMHMDFASKYMKSVLPRQEQNMVLLFDKLRIPPKHYDMSDDLVNKARKRLNEISELFLEEYVSDQGKTERRFGRGVNPLMDGAWSLMPIRRVLDAFERRGEIIDDDVEIVTLSLLFSVLLLKEQTSLFYTLYTPGQVYVHMAELFLLGPDVFNDKIVLECFNRLMNGYLIKRAKSGLLSLKLTKSISGLDAFFPFYEELLKRYSEFSLADDNFALMLLIPGYMNSSISDALTIRLLLWSEHSEIVRQITIGKDRAMSLMEYINSNVENMSKLLIQSLAEPFNLLLEAYKTALENKLVIKERNPLLYHIATQQLEIVNNS